MKEVNPFRIVSNQNSKHSVNIVEKE